MTCVIPSASMTWPDAIFYSVLAICGTVLSVVLIAAFKD
jgi:hypothetical protein